MLLIGLAVLIFLSRSVTDSQHVHNYSDLVDEAQCKARCAEKYGVRNPEDVAKNIYDVYSPKMCKSIHCVECMLPCRMKQRVDDSCGCSSGSCSESCRFWHNAGSSGGMRQSKLSLHLDTPVLVCKYTGDGGQNSALLRIRWNVKDQNGTTTNASLAFAIEKMNLPAEKSVPQWIPLGTSLYSHVPIEKLNPDTSYKFRVTAVHESGLVSEAQESGVMTTFKESFLPENPKNIIINKQKVRGTGVDVSLSWNIADEPVCFYKIWYMNVGEMKTIELMNISETKYVLPGLSFGKNYTLKLCSSYDERFRSLSNVTTIWLLTADCFTATGYNYSICAPPPPQQIGYVKSDAYKEDGINLANITLFWSSPDHVDENNTLILYEIQWMKTPVLEFSEMTEPHHGRHILNQTQTSINITRLHWDSVYLLYLRSVSVGGIGEAASIQIILKGSSYINYSTMTDEFNNTREKETNLPPYVIPLSIGMPMILLIVVTSTICGYRRRLQNNKPRNDKLSTKDEVNPLYSNLLQSDTTFEDEYEIHMGCLKLLETLGEGAFGRVVKAEFAPRKRHARDREKQIVAVKILKELASNEERRTLLKEIESMKHLGYHSNIVSIIGCNTVGRDICLVIDYCPLGDLRKYLIQLRETFYGTDQLSIYHSRENRISDSFSNPNSSLRFIPGYEDKCTSSILKNSTLLSYARQIAMGMEYLSQKRFIHRDLAARNILMYDEEKIKISDFGLARDIYDVSFYQPTSSRKLPYKWMPVEAIFDRMFTIKSDVWSFGIVMWEIVTLGGCPYPGIDSKRLFSLLQKGYRMERPPNCSQEIYQMMLMCWKSSPCSRPNFIELRSKLELLLEATRPYIDLSVRVSKNYYIGESDSDSNGIQ